MLSSRMPSIKEFLLSELNSKVTRSRKALEQMDAKVPALFGPSADDKNF